MANTLSPAQETFSQHFDAMVPLIMAEWPQLIEENLLATEGDLDLTVAYISGETDRTQTLIRRQIKELASLVEPEAVDPEKVEPKDKAAIAPPIAPNDDVSSSSSIDNLLDDLESRTEHLIQELKAEMLPELEQRARSNLGQSLLIALGIGFVLGLILGGKRD